MAMPLEYLDSKIEIFAKMIDYDPSKNSSPAKFSATTIFLFGTIMQLPISFGYKFLNGPYVRHFYSIILGILL